MNYILLRIKYFKKSSKGICADDFENEEQIESINICHLISISELKTYDLPFSGKRISKYAKVSMINGDVYYINETAFYELQRMLSTFMTSNW